MNKVITLMMLAMSTLACQSGKRVIVIPANDMVIMNMNSGEYVAALNNKTTSDIDVSVVDRVSGEQQRGFGLGKLSDADVLVEESSSLVLRNESNQTARLAFRMKESKAESEPQAQPQTAASGARQDRSSVNFTLHNTSARSIPLIIPGVMNPNLSPFSRSGVELAFGQEILFKEGRKKYVLLVVDESIEPGSEINVPKLLRERKEELGL